jgi:hypothetical protein
MFGFRLIKSKKFRVDFCLELYVYFVILNKMNQRRSV